MLKLLLIALIGAVGVFFAAAVCPNSCSGHGICDYYDNCACYSEGKPLYFGSSYDPITGAQTIWDEAAGQSEFLRVQYTGADCSQMTCARGMSRVKHDPAKPWFSSTVAVCLADQTVIADAAMTAAITFGTDFLTITIADYGSTGLNLVAPDKWAIGDTVTITDDGSTGCDNALLIGDFKITALPSDTTIKLAKTGLSSSSTVPTTSTDCQVKRVAITSASPCTKDIAAETTTWFYNHLDNVECSDVGMCDRSTGQCKCFPGYTGSACQRNVCPGDCSGHGVCQSNLMFAEEAGARYNGAWDSGLEFGCLCDSGFRGNACTMQECPSSADPNEYQGNEAGRDCSGRGICDYSNGECDCFTGYSGVDCGTVSVLS